MIVFRTPALIELTGPLIAPTPVLNPPTPRLIGLTLVLFTLTRAFDPLAPRSSI